MHFQTFNTCGCQKYTTLLIWERGGDHDSESTQKVCFGLKHGVSCVIRGTTEMMVLQLLPENTIKSFQAFGKYPISASFLLVFIGSFPQEAWLFYNMVIDKSKFHL